MALNGAHSNSEFFHGDVQEQKEIDTCGANCQTEEKRASADIEGQARSLWQIVSAVRKVMESTKRTGDGCAPSNDETHIESSAGGKKK